MNRRALLATLGSAAFAGCASRTTPTAATSTTTTRTTTHPGNEDAELRVVALDPDPLSMPASVTLSLVRNYAPDHPAVFEFALTNHEGGRTYSFGPTPPWSMLRGRHRKLAVSATLVPDPPDDAIPDESRDGCWRPREPYAPTAVPGDRTLAAGETVRERYALLGTTDNDHCLSAGRYRFADDDYLGGTEWGFDAVLDATPP
jgi:hypothetical protein